MPTTDFVSGTVIGATWLNEVDDHVFSTAAQRLTQLGLSASGGSDLVGFAPAAGSATGLSVQDELRRRVNVVACGADPTGAADSAQAFRDAITAANGGLVIVPAGTYKILSTVNITSGLVLRGEGAFINSSTSQITILSITSSNVTIEGLKFTGAGNSSYNTNGRLISISGTDNGAAAAPTYLARVRIRDCFFYYAGRAGIHATFVDHFMIERCTFNQIGYAMIELNSCTRALVSQSYFKTVSPGTGGNSYGVYFSRTNAADTVRYPQSQYGTVRDCYFQEIPWEAIDCHGVNGFTVEGNTIYDCGEDNCAIALIYGDDEASTPIIPVTNCRVVANYIFGNTNRAIAMSTMDSVSIVHRNVVIEGNTIEDIGNPDSVSGAFGGISVSSVVNCSVTGNTLSGVSPYGIMVRGLSSDNVTITGNTIERAYSESNPSPAGIVVTRGTGAAGAIVISGNTLTSRTMSPPDTYQNVYGVRVFSADDGNVRLGVNHMEVATTQYGGDIGKFGSAAAAITNFGVAALTASTISASTSLVVTLPNAHTSNTSYIAMATVNARAASIQPCVVDVLRTSATQITIYLYTANAANFGANGTVNVLWQTIGF